MRCSLFLSVFFFFYDWEGKKKEVVAALPADPSTLLQAKKKSKQTHKKKSKRSEAKRLKGGDKVQN